jgi:hypothetical protein
MKVSKLFAVVLAIAAVGLLLRSRLPRVILVMFRWAAQRLAHSTPRIRGCIQCTDNSWTSDIELFGMWYTMGEQGFMALCMNTRYFNNEAAIRGKR